MIDHMAGIDHTIIDVYHRVKKPNRYGSGPFWVEYNRNLKRYMDDHWENAKYPGVISVFLNRGIGAIHYGIGLFWKHIKKMEWLKSIYRIIRGRK